MGHGNDNSRRSDGFTRGLWVSICCMLCLWSETQGAGMGEAGKEQPALLSGPDKVIRYMYFLVFIQVDSLQARQKPSLLKDHGILRKPRRMRLANDRVPIDVSIYTARGNFWPDGLQTHLTLS